MHGPDGLEPAEIALFSDLIYGSISTLLNLVEAGAGWPKGIVKARASCLETDR